MSADQQATLDAYVDARPTTGPEPSPEDEVAENAACAPDGSVEGLAEIFHSVVGEYETVEEQEETPSHAPIEAGHEVPDLSEDGLDDAADSDLTFGGWI